MKFYRCTDRIPLMDRDRLGAPELDGDMFRNQTRDGYHIMAVRTFEFRAPRKGEWYLSGSSPTAWRAPSDLSTEYHIMRLAVVERTTMRKLKEVIR